MNRRLPWRALMGFALISAILLSACIDLDLPSHEAIGTLRQAVGEPQNGFPNWEERVVLMLTNRARADPAAEVAAVCPSGCMTYAPSRALAYNYNQGRAARFQATSLVKAKSGLMHDSVCKLVSDIGTLYPDSCDGSPSCACVSGTVSCTCSGTKPYCTDPDGLTSTASRVSLFGASYRGENAAAGNSDPIKTFGQWVRSSGHWSNINKSSHARLGVGHFNGAGCYRDFWVQVFSGGTTPPKIPSGAHYPRSGTGSTAFTFTANFYDPAGAKPALATVNVDGTCHPMTLERGVDNAGSYRVAQALGSSGCHHYYFYFRDSADAIVTYPTSGSYGISVGGTTCTDFDAGTRPSPGQGCGGCFQPSDCDDHNPCTNDTCAANRCENKAIAGCCSGPAQCDDGDPCTNDTCTANACKHATIAGCCTVNTDCPDADPCTEDTCAAHQCAHKTIASCCTTAAQCDDTDPCTADDCHANACTHDTITGCCTKDTECDDGSACTKDRCEAHACAHDPIAGCCTQDADCADTNPCTLTSCTLPAGNCAIEHIKNCCATDTDCDDTDPCTRDTCGAQNTCNHAAITGPGCIPPPSDGGGTPGSDGGSGADPGTHKPTGALIGSCQIGASPGSFAFSLLFALGILGCRRRHPRLSR